MLSRNREPAYAQSPRVSARLFEAEWAREILTRVAGRNPEGQVSCAGKGRAAAKAVKEALAVSRREPADYQCCCSAAGCFGEEPTEGSVSGGAGRGAPVSRETMASISDKVSGTGYE